MRLKEETLLHLLIKVSNFEKKRKKWFFTSRVIPSFGTQHVDWTRRCLLFLFFKKIWDIPGDSNVDEKIGKYIQIFWQINEIQDIFTIHTERQGKWNNSSFYKIFFWRNRKNKWKKLYTIKRSKKKKHFFFNSFFSTDIILKTEPINPGKHCYALGTVDLKA